MSLFPKYHGIQLANGSTIDNLHVERLAADPSPVTAGRVWFNTADKQMKFTGIDAGGVVRVYVFATLSEMVAALAESKSYTDAAITQLRGTSPEALDTLQEIATALNNDPNVYNTLVTLLTDRVAQAKTEILGNVGASFDTLAELETGLAAEIAARVAGDTAEANARTAGDTVLQNAIIALTNRVATEEAARAAADTALQAEIDAEETRALGVEATLATAIQAEAARAANAEGNLTSLTTGAKGNLVQAINEVNAAVGAEVTRAQAAEAALAASVTAEASRATAAEAARAASVTAQIADVASDIADVTTMVDAEVARAQGAEASLQAELDRTQLGAGLNADGTFTAPAAFGPGNLNGVHYIQGSTSLLDAAVKLDAALVSETGRAQAAEANLATSVSAEATRAQAAEAVLSSAVSAEVTRAQAAEAALTASVAAEATRAQAAEAVLTSAVSAEATRAQAAEAALTASVAAEAAAREAAVAAEAARAGTVEIDLQAQIDDLEAAAGTGASALRVQLNDTRFSFVSPAAALIHTVPHNLGVSPLLVSVTVQGDDGKFRNDIVAVEETDLNTITIGMTEARNVKVAVMSVAALVAAVV